MSVMARRLFLHGMRRMQREQVAAPRYDPIQVEYLSENCIAVDENDQIIGGMTKGEAHRVETLGLNRAFSLFAFTPDKKLILQKRSPTKLSSHPLIASEQSCATGVVTAVVRKIEHELGFVDLKPKECHVMGRFLYKALGADSLWGEHELDYAVVTKNLPINRLTPNPEEVSDIRAVHEKELADWIASESSSFSPWFRLFDRLRFLSECWSNVDHIENHPVNMSIVRMN
ncbi:hypothetical protein KIN20_012408 [Parelaphostrongylus tenuis]|uniref:isopentenyl-diphosphate Delta-isomerase n=1 Tax=Parelaphostrongylus tenuis TaxID=148309 RepID=A0AAD5MF75_PARTN|nr:hypothetical protein KIN20_012404 [Parelaphostrongylus tenuis]KAJ1355128.1 hypothetical protein KIN20_012408 [Parelaphostrongylus tenuis]